MANLIDCMHLGRDRVIGAYELDGLLVDPEKLLQSASRLYGDDMERLWGEVLPVPAANVVALGGGEEVEGFRVAYVPGHASHHVAYLHEATGDAYVGDVAGVRIPPRQ